MSEQLVFNSSTAPRPTSPTRFHVGNPFAGDRVATPGAPGSPLEFTYDKVTSRFAFQRQFSDSIMGYVSYSEGFNSGGVAAPTIQGVRTELPYKPQTIETSEIGLRSDLADGKIRFNATLFDTKWKDFQSAGVVYDSQGRQVPQLQTTNVGDAAAEGVEFEFTWLPIESLMLNVGLGLLDTEYTDLPVGQTSGHLAWTTETEFARAPDTSYTVGVEYTAMMRTGGRLRTRVDYNYQSQFWRFEPFLRMDAYPSIPAGIYDESGDWGIVNARLSYAPADAAWEVALIGTNLTDEYMINSGFFHGIWGFDFATSLGRARLALRSTSASNASHCDETQAPASNRRRPFVAAARALVSALVADAPHELKDGHRERPITGADGVRLRDVRVAREMHTLDGLARGGARRDQLVGFFLEHVGVELRVVDEERHLRRDEPRQRRALGVGRDVLAVVHLPHRDFPAEIVEARGQHGARNAGVEAAHRRRRDVIADVSGTG
jgi:hypothetical protein